MAQSRMRIAYHSPLKIRGARGVMKEIRQGKRNSAWPGHEKEILNLKHQSRTQQVECWAKQYQSTNARNI